MRGAAARALVVAAGLSLAACAATPPPPPPAVLSLEGRTCAEDYALDAAVPVAPEKYRKQHDTVAEIGPGAPCATRDGEPATYAAFALPPASPHHLFTVGALPETLRMFAPVVETLRADGTPSRVWTHDDLVQRGAMLSAQFRARPDEAYVIVRSDPARVGDRRSAIETGVTSSQTVVCTGTAYCGSATMRSGYDAQVSRVYSHEGRVVVRMQDRTPKEERQR